jgi:hypothetical protein
MNQEEAKNQILSLVAEYVHNYHNKNKEFE